MSYILDALKKSDQQRQRGTTPALPIAQVTVAVPKRHLFIYYGLLAAVLLVTGVMIGWLHPWQHEQTLPETEPITAESPIPISQQVEPAQSEKPGDTALVSAEPGAAEPVPDKSAKLAGVAAEQEAIPLNELPLTIQQEIPAMTVQLHAYSSNSIERLVSVNSTRLREGEYLMPGLRLEQITPDGMIFSYKGYRFQRGIR
ncbi:MAG: hypothetical protein A2V79_02040 [Betaproteobacteria bacterium RBG_16_56_24]|nr:MAG: hypothetical protein A2V79_02040 [Betaproteobacteria bacterium RBG_16_56_24]